MSRRLQSPTYAERKRKRRIYAAILGIVALTTWVFALERLVSLPTFAIESVGVFGADSPTTPLLEAAAMHALQGSYFGVFPRSSILIYPKSQVLAAIRSVSPQIDSVVIRRDGLHSLIVSVNQKTPAALVCATLPDFDGTDLSDPDLDSCYLADATGFIYAPADGMAISSYPRYYIPDLSDTGTSTIIGAYATSTDLFASLQSVQTGMHDAGLDVQGILLKPGGEYEAYVIEPAAPGSDATDAGTIVVYMNDTGVLADEVANLAAFWHAMTDPKRDGGPVKGFEYIDLRYGTNVFYKATK